MKRIGTLSIHTSQLSGGVRVEAATGVQCPETGWWFPLGNPQRQTLDCQPSSGDGHPQAWANGIWPDCLD